MLRFYLDFDGVIADSARECIHVAYSVWSAFNESKLFGAISEQQRTQILEQSINFRYLVIPPENYYCLIDTIFQIQTTFNSEVTADDVIKLFYRKVESADVRMLTKFKEEFFSSREEKLATCSDTSWVAENPPTVFVREFFRMAERYPIKVSIVSQKNRQAIKKWFNGAGFTVDAIFGNESVNKYGGKFNLIKDLQRSDEYQKAVFIDDMALEINPYNWKNINVITFIAGWGFNDFEDNTQALLLTIKGHLDDLSN